MLHSVGYAGSSSEITTLVLILSVGLTVLAVAFTIMRVRAQRRIWQELAEQFGLAFEPGGWLSNPSISGVYRGRSLNQYVITRGTSKNRTSYTIVALGLRQPTGMTFSIYEENVFNRIGKALGKSDIQTGDQEMDDRFIIQGQPEIDMQHLLAQFNVRQRLLDTPHLNLKLDGNRLIFERQGVQTNVEYLQKVFDLLSELADGVEHAAA
jgi:hypothetical protein